MFSLDFSPDTQEHVRRAQEQVRMHPMDPVQRSHLSKLAKQDENPLHLAVREHLLRISGFFVLIPVIDEDLQRFPGRARLLGPASILSRGQPSRCHSNVAALWETHRPDFRIWTGYALSGDGIWRQHSWGMDGGEVVETTIHRLLYFGIEQDEVESGHFSFNN